MINTKKSLAVSVIGVLVLGLSLVSGTARAATFCSGDVVVDVTQHITNDPDSAFVGGNWALDNFDRHIQIFQDGSDYCGQAEDSGTFTTFGGVDGKSPQSGDALPQVMIGSMNGSTHGMITGGAFSTSTPLVDSVDCSADPAICSAGLTSYWVQNYFGGSANYDYGHNWSWTYTSSLGESWVNQDVALGGNSGDIHAIFDATSHIGYMTLQSAINAAAPGDVIEIGGDLTISSLTLIGNSVTINGNGHTLLAPIDNSANSNSNNAGIGIVEATGNVTINNLTVDGAGSTKVHGINIFESSDVVLNNVTVQNNSKSGITVNGSSVVVNNVTTTNNAWGGINADKAADAPDSTALTVNGTSHHTETNAHIWVDDITKDVSVVDTNNQYGFHDVGNLRVYRLAPKITLNGGSFVSVFTTNGYVEDGASAVDGAGVTIPVVITGSVDDQTPGTYILTYSATDAFGITASVDRKVVVLASSGGGGFSSSNGDNSGNTGNVNPGEVLGATTVSPEIQAQIDTLKIQIIALIQELIKQLQAQLAAASAAGNY